MITLKLGDCLDVMRTLPDNSVDSVVTDAPYGMSKEPKIAEVMQHWINGDTYSHKFKGFMGKDWDSFVPGPEVWRECHRVLKPGGYLLCFASTRTFDLMAVSIRFANFEIRDMCAWLHGQGFPKSHNLDGDWAGWGTALKPANEPIVVARKPLEKGLTVAANVLKWGTGALNIDGSRIGPNPGYSYKNGPGGNSFSVGKGVDGTRTEPVESTQGRWPSNCIFDEEAAAMLDEQSGALKSNSGSAFKSKKSGQNTYGKYKEHDYEGFYGDSGGASRFFYCAKASKSERNAGLEGMPLVKLQDFADGSKRKLVAQAESDKNPNLPRQNFHPTVKPIKLMSYLINLVTPPGGIVLEPFMGSGTTGVAAKLLGFKFIGIERDPDYFAIAQKRIENAGPEVKEPDPQLEFPA